MALVFGTGESEKIDFSYGVWNQADVIFANGGDDLVFGYGGNDRILGMDGNDVLIGGAGADQMIGGIGVDTASYAPDYDSPVGVTVSLMTGTGSFGNAAGDMLIGIENLSGSNHADLLIGNNGSNSLYGNGGNDALHGGNGDDYLKGSLNDDILHGGSGADYLDGESGIDYADYNDSGSGVIVSLAGGKVFGGTATGDTLVAIENVMGSGYADLLVGDKESNSLQGNAGNDILKGGGGADTLYGGTGSDTASYDGSIEGVSISLLAGSGTYGDAQDDKLHSIENLTGSAHDDFLKGNDYANTLKGGLGKDFLRGDSGPDVLMGGSGIDTAVYQGGPVAVFVSLITGSGSGGDAKGDTLSGIENLLGSDFADQLEGNDAANELTGNGGIDTMNGGAGNDSYIVDNADKIVETTGEGTDNVSASVSYTLAAGVSVETLRTIDPAVTKAINLKGNEIANIVTGNAGANVLNGASGNDTLKGNAGADIFAFNTALNAASNVDAIADFSVLADKIRLENSGIFTGLIAGVLNADAFHKGAAAADAEDRIVYNSATGELIFDSNGSAAGGTTLFATLKAGLALTNNQFEVV